MMTKFQLFITAEASSVSDKSTVLKFKRIKADDDTTWYSLPEDFQLLTLHKALLELTPVKNTISSIKTRGQYRNVNVIMSAELEKLYRDEAGNFVYNGFVLAETFFATKTSESSSSSDFLELAASLNKLAEKKSEDSLKEIIKHFLVEKFSTKHKNVESWIDSFEKEISRFELKGSRVIEIFRLCLDASMNDWFLSSQKKFGVNAEWKLWKEDLISTFSDRSWRPVRYAYSFKFLNGSYIDYIVKKERLLLELDHEIPEPILMNLIVLGLPVTIQNTLNRSSITNLKGLIQKMKKFDGESTEKGNSTEIKSHKLTQHSMTFERSKKMPTSKPSNEKQEKKPCSICEKNGRSNRFHSENQCWFRDSVAGNIKTVNNIALESELNTLITDQKN